MCRRGPRLSVSCVRVSVWRTSTALNIEVLHAQQTEMPRTKLQRIYIILLLPDIVHIGLVYNTCVTIVIISVYMILLCSITFMLHEDTRAVTA